MNQSLVENRKLLLKQQYNQSQSKKKIFTFILIPLVFLVGGLAVAFGSADIAFADVYRTIFSKLFPSIDIFQETTSIIIWKLRLPRVVMGILAGIALGSSGAVMQVILKNPLADPYMLGISSAAGFGASLAIIFEIGIFSGSYLIIGNAFVFSILSAVLILVLSGKRNSTPEKMVLIGLALLFFFQALTTMLQYFGDSDAVKAAVFWTVGDLGKSTWDSILISFPIVLLGLIILIWKSGELNIMNSGDACAKSLGINVKRNRIVIMLVCSLMVATIVSFTGTIGFIGLVAPHLVRMAVGSDNKILIFASAIVGALLLVIADTIARTLISPVILPVGSVTAFLGVPLLLYLIMRKKGASL